MAAVHRVVLANDSLLLRGMLKRVFSRVPNLEVVGEIADLAKLLTLVESTDPEWAIVPLSPDGSMPDIIDTALKKHSSVHFLGMTTDGSRARMKRIGCRERHLGSLSLKKLIAILTNTNNCAGKPIAEG